MYLHVLLFCFLYTRPIKVALLCELEAVKRTPRRQPKSLLAIITGTSSFIILLSFYIVVSGQRFHLNTTHCGIKWLVNRRKCCVIGKMWGYRSIAAAIQLGKLPWLITTTHFLMFFFNRNFVSPLFLSFSPNIKHKQYTHTRTQNL